MQSNKRLSRRDFVHLSALGAAGTALAACAAPPAAPQVIKETVVVAGTPEVITKVVEETVVVEAKETVVVEKQVPTGPTNIRFSVWYGQGDIEVWDQVIDAFEKATPDVKIDFEPLAWTQYWQKLQVGLAAGDPPDAIGMGIGVVYDYIGRKQLLLLNPLLEAAKVDMKQWFPGLLAEAIWPKDSSDLYALPYRFTGSAFFVNKTLFDKKGVKLPEKGWTWPTEYLKLAQDLTDTAAEQWGSGVPGGQLVEPFMATNDTSVLTPDLRKSNFLDPKVEEVFQFLADLICKEKVAPKPVDVQGMGDLFLSGKVAMWPDAQWDITAYRKITDFEWDIIYNPLKDGVNKMGTYGGPDMLAIPTSSKNPDPAWKFTLFSTGSPEAQKLMSATAVPTLVAEASNPAFVQAQSELGPKSYSIIVEQAANAVGYSFSPGWNEWMSVYGQAMGEVYNCNMPLKDALTEIDAGVNKVLDAAFAALEKGS
jgi:multiple sugar transport system substrate-binding protein